MEMSALSILSIRVRAVLKALSLVNIERRFHFCMQSCCRKLLSDSWHDVTKNDLMHGVLKFMQPYAV